MSFSDEIKEVLGIDGTGATYRITVFGERAAYFENIKCVKFYAENEISVSVFRGEITVKGENLFIKKYCAGDLAVCGKITAIERK